MPAECRRLKIPRYIPICAVLSFLIGCVIGIACGCVSAKGDGTAETDTMAESTRIEAPKPIEKTERVREPAVTEADEIETTVTVEAIFTDAPAVTDALEIMSDLPLRAEVQLEIEQMCADRDIDPAVVVAMIYHESRYDESKIGDDGEAFGLMQVRLDCHYDRMERLGVTDLLDGTQNVIVGIDYLDEMLHKYGGDYAIALTAYNRGHYSGFVNKYAEVVLATAEEFR